MNNRLTSNESTKVIDIIINCNKAKDDGQQLTDPLQHNFLINKNDDMSKTADKKTKDIYERATNRIIALLEKGEVAWRRTWGTYGFAKNFKTGHVYTGINFLFMNYVSEHPIPYYLSYKQAKALGGNVKKGAKAEYIFFYKGYYKDANGNNISESDSNLPQYENTNLTPVRFLKCYPVFNIEDTEGIEWERPQQVERPNKPIEKCEAIIQNMPEQPTFKLVDANRAFYYPDEDIINVPDIKQFENSEFFYRTTFHEIAHWTGAEKRLARVGIIEAIEQGSDRYAEEEMIAELTSNYILNIAGVASIDAMEVSAGYLKGWISRLKEDPKILFRVAPKAQTATQFIFGKPLTEMMI